VIAQLKTQTPRHVAVAALLLTALGFVLGGVTVGIGAAIGGVVAVLDTWAIIWLVTHVVLGAGLVRQGIAVALLVTKLGLVLAICWALLARWGADPVGFSLGLSALVVGMLYAGARLSLKEAQSVGEG
jgi:hypothetical protein